MYKNKVSDLGTNIQEKLIRGGVSKLSYILRRVNLDLDFNKSLVENEFIIRSAFIPIINFLSSYAETATLTAIDFSRKQLKYLDTDKYSVKSADIEITVNWSLVDSNALNLLRTGGNFSNPYFDIVTEAIAVGNRNWLTNEYTAFVLGEKNLKQAYQDLRDRLLDPGRAERIIRGETTQLWANAQQEAYRSSGTIRNTWETRNDGPKVCPICQPLNGATAVIGQPFLGTRYTKPAAHGGCRCWLSPDPMTDEEIEALLNSDKKPATLKIERKKKPKKEEVVTSVSTPSTPKLNSISDIEKAFTDLNVAKWDRYNRLIEEEQKARNKLNSTSKANFKAMREYDQAKNRGEDYEVLEKLNQVKKSAYDNHQKAINTLSSVQKDKGDIDNWSLNEQRKILYAENRSYHKSNIRDNMVNGKNGIPNGLDEFGKLIPEKVLSNSTISFDYTMNYKHHISDPNRAFFSPDDNVIYLYPNVSNNTVIHELGHYLDWNNDYVRAKVESFFNRRTVGETPTRLDSIFPNSGFDAWETTLVDKFTDPYMGKSYSTSKGTITEITSMGLQRIWEDPSLFLSQDRDYFTFIVKDILQRVDND